MVARAYFATEFAAAYSRQLASPRASLFPRFSLVVMRVFSWPGWPLRISFLPSGLLLLALTGRVPAALGQQFAPATVYATTVTPLDLTLADVNGDGKLDVVTANSRYDSAGVMLGTGDGTFQPLVLYPVTSGSFPQAIAVADVNADNQPDLILANYNYNSVSVLLNKGKGTFGAAQLNVVTNNSSSFGVAVTDVNRDGLADLLTANFHNGGVGVHLGTGTGTFGNGPVYKTSGGSPQALAVADVNGDGQPDVVTANGFAANGDGSTSV